LAGSFLATTTLRINSHTSRTAVFFWLAIAAVLLFSFSFLPVAAGQRAFDLAGSAVDPLKQAPGKVLVLVFIRTDCPISNRYAPLIQEMSAKYGHQASFWLVFPDKSEAPEKIRAYLREYGYKLSALRDLEHALVKKSQVKVTPEVAVFDAKRELIYHGRIDNLYQDFGKARRAATTHELADAIEAASKGVAPSAASMDGIGCFISDLQ
jgi:thiol-disulfide isomerase/thioredoxin